MAHLQPAIDAALLTLRAEAEARMTSRCTVRRKTDETTVDDGFEVPVWDEVYVDLPVRLAGIISGAGQSRRVTTAGVEYETALRTAHVPASTTDLRDNDLLEITSGENAGLVLRIVEADWQDQATARRLPVVATSRPEEWS
jgi:hypothetical protein